MRRANHSCSHTSFLLDTPLAKPAQIRSSSAASAPPFTHFFSPSYQGKTNLRTLSSRDTQTPTRKLPTILPRHTHIHTLRPTKPSVLLFPFVISARLGLARSQSIVSLFTNLHHPPTTPLFYALYCVVSSSSLGLRAKCLSELASVFIPVVQGGDTLVCAALQSILVFACLSEMNVCLSAFAYLVFISLLVGVFWGRAAG